MSGRKRLARLLSLVLISLTALSCQAAPAEVETGMTVHYRGADAATLKRQFDLMADMHVTWVRMDVDWSAVESERGQFDWSYPDKIFDEAVARGMKVLIVVAFSPAWAHPSVAAPTATISHSRPDAIADFAAFARVAAE